jgi:predicted ATPase
LRDIGFALFHTMFTCNLAEALGQAGQIAQAVDAIDEAFERSDRNEERWCVAELWRVKGELLLLGDAAKAAEEHFHQSLEWSRRQQALSWELRTAVSLSRLHRRQGRIREAHERLPEVYRQFGEGLETADLKSARALLEVPV